MDGGMSIVLNKIFDKIFRKFLDYYYLIKFQGEC